MRRLAPLAALALLAACSAEEPDPEPSASATPAPASPAPVASAEPAPEVLQEVPAAFLGYWDDPAGKCAAWSEGQMTIEPTRLTFYESTGAVTGVKRVDADTITISMAVSGEGEKWDEEVTYRLLDGGSALESSIAGSEPIRSKRCAALADVPFE